MLLYWPDAGIDYDCGGDIVIFGWRCNEALIVSHGLPLNTIAAVDFTTSTNNSHPLGRLRNDGSAHSPVLDELRRSACKDLRIGVWLEISAHTLSRTNDSECSSVAIADPSALSYYSPRVPCVTRVEDASGNLPPGDVNVVLYSRTPGLAVYPRYCCIHVDCSGARLAVPCDTGATDVVGFAPATPASRSHYDTVCVSGICSFLNGAGRFPDGAGEQQPVRPTTSATTSLPSTPDPISSPPTQQQPADIRVPHRRGKWSESMEQPAIQSATASTHVKPRSIGTTITQSSCCNWRWFERSAPKLTLFIISLYAAVISLSSHILLWLSISATWRQLAFKWTSIQIIARAIWRWSSAVERSSASSSVFPVSPPDSGPRHASLSPSTATVTNTHTDAAMTNTLSTTALTGTESADASATRAAATSATRAACSLALIQFVDAVSVLLIDLAAVPALLWVARTFFAAPAHLCDFSILSFAWLTSIGPRGMLSVDTLRSEIDFLMGLPIGLKLNHYLGKRIGGALLIIVDLWFSEGARLGTALRESAQSAGSSLTRFRTLPLPALETALLLAFVCGGATLLLALAVDVFRVSTLHLRWLHKLFTWLHTRQLGLLSSLSLLFRGRKKNVLRGRTDSADFNTAQLLFGTLLFTVAVFLFGTMFVYHSFFTIQCVVVETLLASTLALIAAVNKLPVYATLAVITRQLFRGSVLHLLHSEAHVVIRDLPVSDVIAAYREGSRSLPKVIDLPAASSVRGVGEWVCTTTTGGSAGQLLRSIRRAGGGDGLASVYSDERTSSVDRDRTASAPVGADAAAVGRGDSSGSLALAGSSAWSHSFYALRPVPVSSLTVLGWAFNWVWSGVKSASLWGMLWESLCGSRSSG